MSDAHLAFIVGCIILLSGMILFHILPKESLPPGPKGCPVFGNMFQMPIKSPWIAYEEMSRRYCSGVICLKIPGMKFIIINSMRAANDLFEKRSDLYSSRPRFVTIGELGGLGWAFTFFPYGDKWKKCSNLFHRQVTPSIVASYHRPYIKTSTHTLLRYLVEHPDASMLQGHLRNLTAGLMLSTTYGISIRRENDPWVELLERGLSPMTKIGGFTLFDIFPALQYLPSWLPGMGLKRRVAEWSKCGSIMQWETLDFVKREMTNGTVKSSIASRNLQQMQDGDTWTPEAEERWANILGTMYGAGTETTASVLHTFILAMVQNPDIQRKAQDAIDNVVESERLPEFEDATRIPYLDAILMECLRWRPVSPLGIPHFIHRDDIYNGYLIPANSLVLGNIWAMLHDPSIYGPDVALFRPERFMNASGDALSPDVPPPDKVYGFGRRICPGRFLAKESLWFAMVSLLACFDFEKELNEKGISIDPSGEYVDAMVTHPKPFPCRIKPRNTTKALMIRNTGTL